MLISKNELVLVIYHHLNEQLQGKQIAEKDK